MTSEQDRKAWPGRRIVLKALGLGGLLLAVPKAAWAFFIKSFPIRTVEVADFSFDPASGSIGAFSGQSEPYVLVVDGLVEEPSSFSYADLRAMPQTEQVSDFHCVEGWSVADVRWGGLRPAEILNRVRPKPEAAYVVFHSLGRTRPQPEGQEHYIESMPLERLLDPKAQCLLVLDQDGRPLTQPHGAPMRLISPFDLGYKSIKFVRRLELTAEPKPGWWTLANPIYPVDAPVPADRLRRKP